MNAIFKILIFSFGKCVDLTNERMVKFEKVFCLKIMYLCFVTYHAITSKNESLYDIDSLVILYH